MLKRLVKSAARHVGLDVQHFAPGSSRAAQLQTMLAWHGVNLIFDVGANVGQYAGELRSHVGYRGQIVSFEPMSAAHRTLSRAAAGDRAWEVAPRTAVGARTGEVTINIAANSVSSSLLPMLESHARAAPESRYNGREIVPLAPLDTLAAPYFRDDSVAFVKIDTQGYEADVLDGAGKTLQRVVGVQLEFSLVPLYAGQALMPDLLERVTTLGFELWGLAPTFADPESGRMLQVDATFFRAGR